MKIIIGSIFRLTRLFIIEQIREPLALFWSLLAPPLLFLFLNIDALGTGVTSPEWYKQQASWYLSYLALSVSLFGFAMYIIGRRESGFLKSFIQGNAGKNLFLCSQLLASFLLSVVYSIIFIAITTTIYEVDLLRSIILLLPPFFIVSILFIWSAIFLSVFPITFSNANSFVSIIFTMMLIFSIASFKSDIDYIEYLNFFNPLSIATQYLSNKEFQSIESIGAATILLILGCYGAIKMKIEPVWNRQ